MQKRANASNGWGTRLRWSPLEPGRSISGDSILSPRKIWNGSSGNIPAGTAFMDKFWEEYRRRCDPRNGELSLSLFASLPPLCRVCQMPCVFPRPDITTCRIKEYGGKRHAFCTSACERIFDQEPHRYLGYSTFYELFDGYDLADFIVENGLLRADGKTLIAQPWLDMERMWTIDDITSGAIRDSRSIEE